MEINNKIIKRTINKILSDVYIPSSVYRIQFNHKFTFNQMIEFVPYLKEIGFDAVFSSPFLQAAPGSLHGYNITDPHKINNELGSEQDFNNYCNILKQNEMGQIMDVVPNHMGILGDNHLWQDVLENGQSSFYSKFFDIEWNPVSAALKNKVLIPILGSQFGQVLENQELQLFYLNGEFFIKYWDNKFPVAPETYVDILNLSIDDLEEELGSENEDFLEFSSIINSFSNLPGPNTVEHDKVITRYQETKVAKHRLERLTAKNEDIRNYIYHKVNIYNGTKDKPQSFDLLENLLNKQSYKIASWQVACEEINYRRFFDINELIGLRMEEDEVFLYSHELIFKLLIEHKIQGLRIDHPDGLYDPDGYFKKLQFQYILEKTKNELIKENITLPEEIDELITKQINPDEIDNLPLFVVIEKILDRKEPLPKEWLVHGTVGYDYLNAINGLFIYRNNEKKFNEIYFKYTNEDIDYEELLYLKKKKFAKNQMAGEVNTLGYYLKQLAEKNRNYRDFTLNNLTRAIREVIACFPVYRTYVSPYDSEVSEKDARYINISVEKAKCRDESLNEDIYDFIKQVLLMGNKISLSDNEIKNYRTFILHFQQITSPIMAKGAEDTAFYIRNRFISLNEVGSDPEYFGYSTQEFHKQNIERQKEWPYSFITTSTHDTKRSEDVRLRLNVLSELPEEWQTNIIRWARLNKKYKTLVHGELHPGRNTEYFIYQTLIGVWPDYEIETSFNEKFIERIWKYIQKAVREAKTFTSWTAPDLEYENAVRKFVENILQNKKKNYFLKLFKEFHQRVASFGMYNSLSSLVIKLCSPGITDFYQGSELWNYSLVDPDNRRPIDFNLRRHLFYRVKDLLCKDCDLSIKTNELLVEKRDSRIKVFTLYKGLLYRKQNKELFLDGSYLPLEVKGALDDYIVAFLRKKNDKIVVAAVGRFFSMLLDDDTQLPIGENIWNNTKIILPGELENQILIDIYTEQAIKIYKEYDEVFIYVKDVLQYFSFSITTNSF